MRLRLPLFSLLVAATLDVAGSITVSAFENDTAECEPGRDVALEYTTSFELGAPRKVEIVVYPGGVDSSAAKKRGGYVHEGRVVSYSETNDCPPTSPVSPGKPKCTKLRGLLLTRVSEVQWYPPEEGLRPLARGLAIRLGSNAGNQLDQCVLNVARNLDPMFRNAVIELFEAPLITELPLGATDAAFRRLRKGQALRREIKLSGTCKDVRITSGPAEQRPAPQGMAGRGCIVNGKIAVTVRRVS